MTILTQSTTWQALSAHSQNIPHMRELFASDPARFTKMSLSSCGLFLDYSKNRATPETLN
ncbi:MAG: glucose-6-phosphate isomerase, partial [Shewanella sp.]